MLTAGVGHLTQTLVSVIINLLGAVALLTDLMFREL